MTEEPVLVVDNLSYRYRIRDEFAIVDVSLQISAGEVLLVAGSSGSGKTTLARCINGLIPRSYKGGEILGDIRLSGLDTTNMSLSEVSKYVGTVLQDPERQILGTKVINEVAFGLENFAMPRQEIIERVEAAMSYLRILDLRDRDTFNLSGGEKQKVALAGVLALEPSLLLLDEPLASLDPASAQEALRMMRELADSGLAVLIVEHRVEDVLKIKPDRIVFMTEGRVAYDGHTDGLASSVNYHEVKLPAQTVMELAAKEGKLERFEKPQFTRDVKEESLVQFEQVSFFYEEGVNVLDDINLEIRPGEVIAILGPNGAGKTTLVKQAIGLLKPKKGRVLVEGNDTQDLSVAEVASTLGYVFQSPSHMLFARSVLEELSFGPNNLGIEPEDVEKEVQKAVDIMNLAGMEEDPPLALSFGQQKRVSIAAILAMRSKILVMDEPTAGQDYMNYMGFMDSILQIPSFDAIIFITHDIDIAVVYANRVILIDNGRIVADGSPEEVLADYQRLDSCRLVPTSLLDVNLAMLAKTGGFLRAESLAFETS